MPSSKHDAAANYPGADAADDDAIAQDAREALETLDPVLAREIVQEIIAVAGRDAVYAGAVTVLTERAAADPGEIGVCHDAPALAAAEIAAAVYAPLRELAADGADPRAWEIIALAENATAEFTLHGRDAAAVATYEFTKDAVIALWSEPQAADPAQRREALADCRGELSALRYSPALMTASDEALVFGAAAAVADPDERRDILTEACIRWRAARPDGVDPAAAYCADRADTAYILTRCAGNPENFPGGAAAWDEAATICQELLAHPDGDGRDAAGFLDAVVQLAELERAEPGRGDAAWIRLELDDGAPHYAAYYVEDAGSGYLVDGQAVAGRDLPRLLLDGVQGKLADAALDYAATPAGRGAELEYLADAARRAADPESQRECALRFIARSCLDPDSGESRHHQRGLGYDLDYAAGHAPDRAADDLRAGPSQTRQFIAASLADTLYRPRYHADPTYDTIQIDTNLKAEITAAAHAATVTLLSQGQHEDAASLYAASCDELRQIAAYELDEPMRREQVDQLAAGFRREVIDPKVNDDRGVRDVDRAVGGALNETGLNIVDRCAALAEKFADWIKEQDPDADPALTRKRVNRVMNDCVAGDVGREGFPGGGNAYDDAVSILCELTTDVPYREMTAERADQAAKYTLILRELLIMQEINDLIPIELYDGRRHYGMTDPQAGFVIDGEPVSERTAPDWALTAARGEQAAADPEWVRVAAAARAG